MNNLGLYSNSLDNSFPLHQPPVSPRLINRTLNIVRHAVDVVKKQNGHVTHKAIADYLGVSINEYNHILQDANFYRLFNSKREVA
jgi:DNA-directed RNA polymerase specialized sigma subunit